jgi:3-deoxy-D-manno-octulosonic-acid transferase
MSDLLSASAIMQVADEEKLTAEILSLLGDAKKRQELGERAKNAVVRRRGVVDRCAKSILEALR